LSVVEKEPYVLLGGSSTLRHSPLSNKVTATF
jgi:hypothetical protein